MARAIAMPLRQAILDRFHTGQAPEAIAAALGLHHETVRKLVRRFRTAGTTALAPAYDRCGQHQTATADADLVDAALDLRRQHTGWGAGLIRVLLAEQFPGRTLPSERTLQRHLAKAGLAPAPAGRPNRQRRLRATVPHEVWQVDAAERMTLGDGSPACWLRVVDEYTGAFLRTVVFPPRDLECGAPTTDAGGVATDLCHLGPPRRVAGG